VLVDRVGGVCWAGAACRCLSRRGPDGWDGRGHWKGGTVGAAAERRIQKKRCQSR